MKIKVLLILTLNIFFAIIYNAQEIKSNDLLKSNLKGKIQILKNNSLQVVDTADSIKKKELRNRPNLQRTTITYNKNGNIVEMNVFTNNGRLVRKTKNEYQNNLLRSSIDSSFEFYSRVSYWNYKYDKNNNIIENKIGSKDGKSFKDKAIFEYDKKGNRIKAKQYVRNDDEPNLFIIYSYDAANNLKEEIMYEIDSAVFQKHYYEYDSKNLKIEEEHFTHRGMPQYLSAKSIFTYNKKDEVITEVRYDHMSKEMTKWTFAYEYDEIGNWIKKTEYFEEIPKFILSREIKYYSD